MDLSSRITVAINPRKSETAILRDDLVGVAAENENVSKVMRRHKAEFEEQIAALRVVRRFGLGIFQADCKQHDSNQNYDDMISGQYAVLHSRIGCRTKYRAKNGYKREAKVNAPVSPHPVPKGQGPPTHHAIYLRRQVLRGDKPTDAHCADARYHPKKEDGFGHDASVPLVVVYIDRCRVPAFSVGVSHVDAGLP